MPVYQHLSLEERSKIATLHKEKHSLRAIAAALSRSPATIARELKRNTSIRDGYLPENADRRARKRRKVDMPRILPDMAMRAHIIEKLQLGWTPAEISGRLKHENKPGVCAETIYKFIYLTREGREAKLYKYLKRKQKTRYYRGSKRPHPSRIPAGHSIHDRPAHVQTRAEFGHFEGDLVIGKNGNITTIIERKTRMAFAVKNDSKHSAPVIHGIRQKILALPQGLRRSIAFDQGTEFADHKVLADHTGIHVYFCDPHSPWQKGANENFNGRLRFFYPKGADFSAISQQNLDARIDQMNNTPRKCLGFQTPAEAYNAALMACCTSS